MSSVKKPRSTGCPGQQETHPGSGRTHTYHCPAPPSLLSAKALQLAREFETISYQVLHLSPESYHPGLPCLGRLQPNYALVVVQRQQQALDHLPLVGVQRGVRELHLQRARDAGKGGQVGARRQRGISVCHMFTSWRAGGDEGAVGAVGAGAACILTDGLGVDAAPGEGRAAHQRATARRLDRRAVTGQAAAGARPGRTSSSRAWAALSRAW
jgi:hypothetical protein